jgi:hypothetical protein
MLQRKTTLTLLLSTLLLWLSLASAQDLTYTFADGKLTGPETISVNGFQNITFVNNSDVEMEMSFLRLREGATLEAVEAANKAINEAFATGGDAGKAIGEFLSLADAIGGVNLAPQSQGSIYLKLEPGNYGVDAVSGGGPGETSTSTNLAVTVSEGESTEAPTADFSLHMMDFHFDLPETFSAGEQLWEVNGMGQPHMALIFKLNEGATAEDVLTFMSDTEAGGPPPFDFGMVIPAISSGQTFYTSVNLTPGNYVAVCPLPNLASGAPHFVDGMVDTFTVQ